MQTCLLDLIFRVTFNKADTLPKKYANGGLYLDARVAREETDAENQSVIGGLNDQDAEATWPSYPLAGIKHIQNQSNILTNLHTTLLTKMKYVFIFNHCLSWDWPAFICSWSPLQLMTLMMKLTRCVYSVLITLLTSLNGKNNLIDYEGNGKQEFQVQSMGKKGTSNSSNCTAAH